MFFFMSIQFNLLFVITILIFVKAVTVDFCFSGNVNLFNQFLHYFFNFFEDGELSGMSQTVVS